MYRSAWLRRSRVIQVSQSVGDPSLVLPVLGAREAGEKCVARLRRPATARA